MHRDRRCVSINAPWLLSVVVQIPLVQFVRSWSDRRAIMDRSPASRRSRDRLQTVGGGGSLLPKLISGDIRLRDAENMVGVVA